MHYFFFSLFLAISSPSLARASCTKRLVRDGGNQRLVLDIQTGSSQSFELSRGEPLSVALREYTVLPIALAFSGNRWPEREEELASAYHVDAHYDRSSSSVIKLYVKQLVRYPMTGTVIRDLMRGEEGVFLIKGGPQGSRLLFDSVQHATDDEITFGGRFKIHVRDLAEFVVVPQRIETQPGVVFRH